MKALKIFKLFPEAFTPTYGTQNSACFDLYACIPPGTKVKCWGPDNFPDTVVSSSIGSIVLEPRTRYLVPTGIIFGIPADSSLRIHPRSGINLKAGITVANCEGVVDNDYPEQTYVVLMNISDVDYYLGHGDRMAQGEVVPMEQSKFVVVNSNPAIVTDRVSGAGSTGV
jgi:dUTP pyrophosphatase